MKVLGQEDDPEWTTRRAPHMERFTELRPVLVKDYPDAHRLLLKVGNQQFEISSGVGYYDTKEEAEWVRDMLCIALDRLQRGEDL